MFVLDAREPKVALPKEWPRVAKFAIVHALALAHLVVTHVRSWSPVRRARRASHSSFPLSPRKVYGRGNRRFGRSGSAGPSTPEPNIGEGRFTMVKKAKKSGRKPNAAFMKPLQPDEALAEVVGDKMMPRTEVVKRIWAYIKKHGLQDKKNKRMINADAKLEKVFGGKKQVSMFDMNVHLKKHLK